MTVVSMSSWGRDLLARPWEYLAILKGRRAEYGALTESEGSVLARVTPMFDLVRDDAELAKFLKELRRDPQMRLEGPVLLDGDWLDPSSYEPLVMGVRALQWLPVPVTAPGRSGAYQDAVASAVAGLGTGVALRLGRSHFGEGTLDIGASISQLLDRLGLLPAEVDIIIDLRDLTLEQRVANRVTAIGMLARLPTPGAWRHVALAATGMRRDLTNVEQDAVTVFPRAEWTLYQDVLASKSSLERMPSYGDYAIAHPDLETTGGPGFIPNFRFTSGDDWKVVRGTRLELPDTRFREMLGKLPETTTCGGPAGCAGERWLRRVAFDGASTGNPTTRRQAATVHHLSSVTQKLASPPSP